MCGSVLLQRNLVPVYCWFVDDSSIAPSLAWHLKLLHGNLLKNKKNKRELVYQNSGLYWITFAIPSFALGNIAQ